MTTGADIRRRFLEYFIALDHKQLPSAPLIPENDPSLLFTNAGMVQFKNVFLGLEKKPWPRVVTCQRCVRAGGKHNDLENVGQTNRHHTFFEMLGNFSFGDYFKQEAIHHSWNFLTDTLNLDKERLLVTVYHDDEESEKIWRQDIGLEAARVGKRGEADNFWTMGDVGPCGPCTEIYYQHDNDKEPVEIWNLVFTQYDRAVDGKLSPIPAPSVDTGMGLERITAVVQGVDDNYDTDLFTPIMHAINDMAPVSGKMTVSARKAIADHIRATAFLIADGVVPSNEGRGYVLRRIIRRAIRHGHMLGINEVFFHRLLTPLIYTLAQAWPVLVEEEKRISETLYQEEERFRHTLDRGLRHMDKLLAGLKDNHVPGEVVFRLYDTYGFPPDLTAEIARERGLQVDTEGFDRSMAEQRQRARQASQFKDERLARGAQQHRNHSCRFVGYDEERTESVIVALLDKDGAQTDELSPGNKGAVILDQTPFYPEGGGPVGDSGLMTGADASFTVHDTQKQGDTIVHYGQVNGKQPLHPDMTVLAAIDAERRADIMRNHSATHLLHAALRRQLGAHVTQQGSLVAPDRLRFDFSHAKPLTAEEIASLEEEINKIVLANAPTDIRWMPLEQAKASGALCMFGEKYEEQVRVLTIGGDFSRELCGGVHVRQCGEIGLFKITSETGIASGVRRMEAVTGRGAVAWATRTDRQMTHLAATLGTSRDKLEDQVANAVATRREQQNEMEALRAKVCRLLGDRLLTRASTIDGRRLIAAKVEDADSRVLRGTADYLRKLPGRTVAVLASVNNGNVQMVAAVSADDDAQVSATELVNFVARQVGGKGGGHSGLAQAGGHQAEHLDVALGGVPDWLKQQMAMPSSPLNS